MKFIDEKKIHKGIVIAVLFLSFGYAGWQSTRGMLAYMSYGYPELGQPAWLFNGVLALFIGGAIPLLFYELITAFSSRFVAMRTGGAADDMRYALRFFYIMANIVVGSLKFLYFLTPIASVFGNVLIDFVITSAFFGWFLYYCAKHYVANVRWGAMCLSAGGTYLVVQTVLTVINLITGLLPGLGV